ncbi:hypothetical protein QF037_009735 [Streptomyces canus]|nr:hypothetical protein [Streptomyces canus]
MRLQPDRQLRITRVKDNSLYLSVDDLGISLRRRIARA